MENVLQIQFYINFFLVNTKDKTKRLFYFINNFYLLQWRCKHDLKNQASKQEKTLIQPPTIFNNMPVVRSSCQKHLGIYFDEKLNF